MDADEVSALIAICRTGTAEEKCRAIVDLEDLEAREALPVLIELVSSSDDGVRANVAAALGKLGSCDTAAPSLMMLLDDADALVRVNASQSLGELRCNEGAHRLRSLLVSDPDPLVRLQAAETLGVLRDRASLPSLVDSLRDPDEGVRTYAAKALGQLGVKDAILELQAHAGMEPSPLVKASLLGALYLLGDEAVLAPLLNLVDGVDDRSASTLLNTAAQWVLPQHTALLRSKLEAIARTRPGLVAEAESLLRRLPGGAPGRR